MTKRVTGQINVLVFQRSDFFTSSIYSLQGFCRNPLVSICLFKKQSHLSARDLRYKDGDPTEEKGSVSPTVIVETELNRWINYSLVWCEPNNKSRKEMKTPWKCKKSV